MEVERGLREVWFLAGFALIGVAILGEVNRHLPGGDRALGHAMAALSALVAMLGAMALAECLGRARDWAVARWPSRASGSLVVLTLVIVIVVIGVMAAAPVLADQIAAFSKNLPRYVTKLQSLISDPSRPWLAKLFGGNLPDPGKSVETLVTQGSGFIAGFLTSLWSGGRAVFSVLSLHHQIVPPTINIFNQDPQCDLDYCANTAREMKLDAVMKNNFGFGGTNGCLVFSRI